MKLRELPNTVVHCKTREEYDRLIQIYTDSGWRWSNGREPKNQDIWGNYKERTAITACDCIMYCETAWYEEKGLQIISLSEYLQKQGISEDLKPGDWLEVIESFEYEDNRFDAGTRCRVTEYDPTHVKLGYLGVMIELNDGSRHWITPHASKLRRCSSPEENPKPVCTRLKVDYRPSIDLGHATLTIERSLPDLAIIPFPFSSMDCCTSVISKARRLVLTKLERQYQDLGLKDSHGNLTEEGRIVFIDQLFQKFGKELMHPVVKKLAAKKDEDDE